MQILIRAILQILENNPYVHAFRSVGQMQNLDEFKIELNTSISVDQRRYNALLWNKLQLYGRMGLMKKANLNEVLWFIQILDVHNLYGRTMVVTIP